MKINTKILIVDDEESIHNDFQKILTPSKPSRLDEALLEMEATLFQSSEIKNGLASQIQFQLDFAFQGDHALEMFAKAEKENDPYAVIFTDVRMPPGLDGVQMVKRIRALTPHTEIVIVTAFADYSWETLTETFGWSDHLLILRKPFDTITIKQLAVALTKKWTVEKELREHRDRLEALVQERTEKLTRTTTQLLEEVEKRLRVQKEKRETELRYQTIAEASPVGLFQTDVEGRCLYVNERWCQMAGLTPTQAHDTGWVGGIHPDDRGRILEEWQQSLRANVPFRSEYRFRNRDGEVTWVFGQAVAEKDKSGKVSGYIGTITDVTKRRWAEKELRRAHAELARANKELQVEITQRTDTEEQLKLLLGNLERTNQELKDFAYIVSHDLKAPLRGISSIASWLSEDYGHCLDDEGRGYLGDLLTQTKWMHNLIEGILQYSWLGRSQPKLEMVDTDRLVAETIGILSPPPGIRVEVLGTLPRVAYDRTQMDQLFQNLIGNAVNHLGKPAGHITIRHEDREADVLFRVTDNGVGIEKKHYERIFRMFQTLNPDQGREGSTGIGLSLVKKIVNHHGGEVWVESEPGNGSCFLFTVPKRCRANPTPDPYRILLIDDNSEFSRVAGKMLRQEGHHVYQAFSGTEAHTCLTGSQKVDVVLLDVDLPNEDIFELYSQIREEHAGLKIVACSGDPNRDAVTTLVQLGVDGVLLKPFKIIELCKLLEAD